MLLAMFLPSSLLITSVQAQLEMPQPLVTSEVERVYFSGGGTLRINQGRRSQVQIDAPESVLAALVVEVSDGVLFIEAPPGAEGSDLTIEATLNNLTEIVSDGANRVIAEDLRVSDLSLEARGAGSFQLNALRADELLVTGTDGANFTLSGSVNRQVLDLADHGGYQAAQLFSHSVEATVVGAGFILLSVEDLLDVRLAGAANVRYLGSPFVSQFVSGPGSIEPVAEHSI
jgi:hypothetical protein